MIGPIFPAIRIAVLIPCFNEEQTIERVVTGFRTSLPTARIYVYDNNSRDRTAERALRAGACVRREPQQGKGHVVRRMFADIDADVFVLVDGDDTYEPAAAPRMIQNLLEEGLDMVTASRWSARRASYRRGHRAGNALLTGIAGAIFGRRVSDMLSGYRVFSRRFVKSFPALSAGFETETEFSIHALELRMPISEMPTPYHPRPAGSNSKLRTYADGLRILRTILLLVKEHKPLPFFGVAGILLLAAGVGLGAPVILEFVRSGLVPRLPTAVLASALVILSFVAFVCGLVLDSVARGRKEMKRLAYLAVPGIAAAQETARYKLATSSASASPTSAVPA